MEEDKTPFEEEGTAPEDLEVDDSSSLTRRTALAASMAALGGVALGGLASEAAAAPRASAAPTAPAVPKFFGVDIDTFTQQAVTQLKTGTFSNGTKMDPAYRASYANLVKALQQPGMRIHRHYMFVYELFIWWCID